MTPDLTEHEFELFRRLILERSGISLAHSKKALLRARLAKRLRALNLSTFKAYYRLLQESDPLGVESVRMVDAVSTNLTHFFREPEHFDHLDSVVFKRFARLSRIRILSAGCSTGEEPYSIAISALEHFGSVSSKVEITAVDISSAVVSQAVTGIYPAQRVESLPEELLRKYFSRGRGGNEGLYRIQSAPRALVTFARANLMEPLPFEHGFHAIFCRNVAIYFDSETQKRLAQRFHDMLVPGGTLFVGHSESLLSNGRMFRYVQPAVYERGGA